MKSKVPSLFEMHDRHEVHAHGSSITSFAWEPHEEGKKSKKVHKHHTK